MARARRDPYGKFGFLVEIDGVESPGFTQVLMPSGVLTVFEYREGADAPCSVLWLPGRVRYGNLVLRRGISESDALFEWWNAVCEGRTDRRTVAVVLLDAERNSVKRWRFAQALPVRYGVDPLDAAAPSVATEALELVFESMTLER
jgi:phage tail-like protein